MNASPIVMPEALPAEAPAAQTDSPAWQTPVITRIDIKRTMLFSGSQNDMSIGTT